MPEKKVKFRKVQFSMAEPDIEALHNLMRDSGCADLTEVVRNALTLYRWAVFMDKEGYRFQAVSQDGTKIQQPIVRGVNES